MVGWFKEILTYGQANNVIIKDAIILNIIHNIINLHDTSIILALIKNSDGLNLHLNIKLVVERQMRNILFRYIMVRTC